MYVSPLAPLLHSNANRPLVLECPAFSSSQRIRVILNDGVVSLTGIEGCPTQKDGLCAVDTFVSAQKKLVSAQKKLVEGADWGWTCHGNWTVSEGDAWRTTTGDHRRRIHEHTGA